MKVEVNKDLCLGCGYCSASQNNIFEIGEDGRSEVIMDEIPEELREDVLDVIDGCPTSAIKEVEEKEE